MTSPILLDTCAAIWLLNNKLKPAAGKALENRNARGEPIRIAAVTAWEIGALSALGRLPSPLSPEDFFEMLVRRPGIELIGVSIEVLIQSHFLPGIPPRDPVDRILAACARMHRYTLMTRDRQLLRYAAEGHLLAMEC